MVLLTHKDIMSKRAAILNFVGCSNYGANLTAYAIAEYCKKLGIYGGQTLSLHNGFLPS